MAVGNVLLGFGQMQSRHVLCPGRHHMKTRLKDVLRANSHRNNYCTGWLRISGRSGLMHINSATPLWTHPCSSITQPPVEAMMCLSVTAEHHNPGRIHFELKAKSTPTSPLSNLYSVLHQNAFRRKNDTYTQLIKAALRTSNYNRAELKGPAQQSWIIKSDQV